MSIVDIIGGVNKLAIIAFFITLAFIVYEIFKLLKETKKNKKPIIPEYIQGKYSYATVKNPVIKDVSVSGSKRKTYRMMLLLLFMIVILTTSGMVGSFYYLQNRKVNAQLQQKKSIIEYVSSAGIVLYDAQWNKIEGDRLKEDLRGKKIYVGVADIAGVEIKRARIRINKESWDASDETENFNPDKKIYYREFVIPTSEQGLKIDAQLYDQNNGWLENE